MSSPPAYTAPAPLDASHRLDGFDCGHPSLDTWLANRALENEGRASRTYVVTARNGQQADCVVAYYSLATGSVLRSEVARKLRHNLPNPVPALVLARLAVDRRHRGQGLGADMLREALIRTADISRTAGVRLLIVHAIDDEAVGFYARYGFQVFPAGSRTMHLPIETILAAI